MSAVTTNKVRLYDLAKELKIDTKRLIEEVRREGVDVSVPSNSVSKDLADKIRDKYFPKKDTAVKRGIRVVKKAARPVVEEVAPVEAEEVAQPAVAEPETTPAEETITAKPATTVRKLSPAARAEKPLAAEAAPSEHAPVQVAASSTEAGPPASTEPVPPPSRVRVMRPTAAALNAGIRPGERAPAPPPAAPTTRERSRDRTPRGRVEYAGTPGETLTPQTTYIPPPDAGRRRSRRGSTRGGKRTGEGRGTKFDRDFIPPPPTLTLEERIAGRLDVATAPGELKPVRLVEGSTVKELAEKLGIKPKEIVSLLLQRGVFATINQALNDEVAAELGQRFGYDVAFVPFEEMVAEEEFEELVATDADDVEVPRAPVVTVMGHVDHGKTSLLDAIRTTNVVAGEAGGITQHIGAYSVEVPSPDNPSETRRVVFLDTPGHEAFTLMRARGAKATDVVVLVVAADDGVMPQTLEAVSHARAAKVPIVVAINKIDKPDAQPERVKKQLADHGLMSEAWGGDTVTVEVSAKQRTNLELMLEMILLVADLQQLKANPNRLATGTVLEAKLDRGRGPVATVLVQNGTLRVGDSFLAGSTYGKVRAMLDDRGRIVAEAPPSTPVEVLGLEDVPQAGDRFQAIEDTVKGRQIALHRQAKVREAALAKSARLTLEHLHEQLAAGDVKELPLIIKADVQGSVEVLSDTLSKLSSLKVKIKIIHAAVGAITETDVLLASA